MGFTYRLEWKPSAQWGKPPCINPPPQKKDTKANNSSVLQPKPKTLDNYCITALCTLLCTLFLFINLKYSCCVR